MRAGGTLARTGRAAEPGWFAVVMGTGIVSAALRLAGSPHLSGVLLAIAAATFLVLLAASAWRAAAFPARLRDDVTCPGRAFTCFAFVAACNVLGDRLAGDGHRYPAAALAAAGLAAWLVLTCLIPVRLALRAGRAPTRITDISGSWYLWAVATQSLAIAATFLQAVGLLPSRPAAVAAIAAWTAGAVLYLVTTALVAARLRAAALGPDEATAPYWVAMGAASITVLAAAQTVRLTGYPEAAAARTIITGPAVAFGAIATGLILPLAARSAWRYVCARAPLCYRPDLWMIVFPAGMYATASMQLGTAAALPLIHRIGTAAAWPAATAWTLTFTAMTASVLTRPAWKNSPGDPGNLYRGTIN